MAELTYFYGTMNCGKSTLALQTHHNNARSGKSGILLSVHDRAGAYISSRIGLKQPATVVEPDMNLRERIGAIVAAGEPVDYIICDEACFYTPAQIEQLATVVDDLEIDVFAYGLMRSFTGELFAGTVRLMELADHAVEMQVQALCWCGSRGTHNARTIGGVMVREGKTVVVGDVVGGADEGDVAYEVLCRKHFMRGINRTAADTVIDLLDQTEQASA